MAQLNTTELDFLKIRDNLKSYFKQSDDFSDYDFEGSGLSHLLDVLAYNTHYNAVNAHMAVNESFIDSAQVRANVVSHAKLVGYIPKSVSAAKARINFSLAKTAGDLSSVTLPSGSTFSAEVAGKKFTFQTLADTVSDRYNSDTGNYEFDNLDIFEGKIRTNKFISNEITNEKFVIPDTKLDRSTLKVTVRDSETASSSTTYTLFNVEADINANSTIYYINENYEGYYQIEFGNNALGKKPDANSIIEVEYLSSNSVDANGASTFTYTGTAPANTELASSGAIVLVNPAAGGALRETVESIQFNAPRSFIAQNRAVTTDDYAINVRQALADIQDVTVYGGETLDPPEHGKVFISVKPQGSLFLTEVQKATILNFLEKKRVVTVTPVIVDADYTYLHFTTTLKYNSSLTSLSELALEAAVREKVKEFNNTFLQNYGNNFRYSKFLATLDSANDAIVGTIAQVYAYKRIELAPNLTSGYDVNFNFELLGDVNQEGSYITTTGWSYQGRTYYLEDVPVDDTTSQRTVRRYYINQSNEKIIEDSNVGTLTPSTGRLRIDPQPSAITTAIDITVIPASYDIPGIANKLLTIDITKTSVSADSSLKGASGNIISDGYIRTREASTTTYNPFSASGTFVPHTMYDPVTGNAYYAATYDLHLRYENLGYVHYIPTVTVSQITGNTTGTTTTGDIALQTASTATVTTTTTDTTTPVTQSTTTTTTTTPSTSYTPPPSSSY